MDNLPHCRSKQKISPDTALQILGNKVLRRGPLDPRMLKKLFSETLDRIVEENKINHPNNNLRRSISIFKRYWGLDGGAPCSYVEAGVFAGVSTTRARQHIHKIHGKYFGPMLRRLYAEHRSMARTA